MKNGVIKEHLHTYGRLLGWVFLVIGLIIIVAIIVYIVHRLGEKQSIEWYWYLLLALGFILLIVGIVYIYHGYKKIEIPKPKEVVGYQPAIRPYTAHTVQRTIID